MSKEELFSILDKYNNVVTLFNKESDRAAAILAASYLDVLLEKLLRTKLIVSPVVDELLSGNGPLASFSAKIAICFALGLMPDYIHRDLTLIRRIRNHFAHHMDDASFLEDSIRNRCAELSLHTKFPEMGAESDIPLDARTQFLLSVAIASLTITQPMHKEWIERSHKSSENSKTDAG